MKYSALLMACGAAYIQATPLFTTSTSTHSATLISTPTLTPSGKHSTTSSTQFATSTPTPSPSGLKNADPNLNDDYTSVNIMLKTQTTNVKNGCMTYDATLGLTLEECNNPKTQTFKWVVDREGNGYLMFGEGYVVTSVDNADAIYILTNDERETGFTLDGNMSRASTDILGFLQEKRDVQVQIYGMAFNGQDKQILFNKEVFDKEQGALVTFDPCT